MKKLLRFGITPLLMCALCLNFTACGGDDEPDGTIVVNSSNVFTGNKPQSVIGANIVYNSNGQVTSIATLYGTINFTYGSKLVGRAVDKDKTVCMTYTDIDRDQYVFNLEIGDNGFVKYCEEINSEGSTEQWWFGYNNNGQLNYMKRTEGGNEETTITYNANGDITNVSMTSDEDGNSYTSNIFYTSSDATAMIENKGCLMLFDETFDIDMDEMKYAYFAGLLGKATKHLPISCQNTYDTVSFSWTLNSNGYPTLLSITGEPEALRFSW